MLSGVRNSWEMLARKNERRLRSACSSVTSRNTSATCTVSLLGGTMRAPVAARTIVLPERVRISISRFSPAGGMWSRKVCPSGESASGKRLTIGSPTISPLVQPVSVSAPWLMKVTRPRVSKVTTPSTTD